MDKHILPPVLREQGWGIKQIDLGTPQEGAEQRLACLKALPDKTYDALSFQHGLQRLHLAEVPDILHEFKRLLKVEGFVHITAPDISRVVDYIKKDLLEEVIYTSPQGQILPLDIIYGHSGEVRKKGLMEVHQSGYTPASIGRVLRDAGFYNIRIRREPASMIAAANRPKETYNPNQDKIRIIDPNLKEGMMDELDTEPVHWKPIQLSTGVNKSLNNS